ASPCGTIAPEPASRERDLIRSPETWPRGRRHSPAKGACGQKLHRGFESLLLRQKPESHLAPVMPIYEYPCRACGHQFENLVRTVAVPGCTIIRSTVIPAVWLRCSHATPSYS